MSLASGPQTAVGICTLASGLFAVALLYGTPAQAQSCRSPAAAPYQGPLFDAMAQMDERVGGENAVAVARAQGVVSMALFARSQSRHDGADAVSSLAQRYAGFIVLGAPKRFDMRADLDPGYVDAVVQGVAQRRYAFVGEILYSHTDKIGGEETAEGERYIDPLQPQTARLLTALAPYRVPVMTHWEVYEWSRDWPRFHQLYGQFPGQVFVWPHVGFGSVQQVAAVLSNHPNVWAILSKKDTGGGNFADADRAETVGDPILDECGAVELEWLALMRQFSGRVMFATDAHKTRRWAGYANIVARWRSLLGQLPPDIAAAIAYGNAARLYGVHASGG
jgi:hypothetical protein